MIEANTTLPALPDLVRFALLSIFIVVGAYWQLCEIRYWRAVRAARSSRPSTPWLSVRVVYHRKFPK